MSALALPATRPASAPVALSLFRWIARRRIAAELDGLHVSGLAAAATLLAQRPVIFAPTHTSWWDGMVVLALDEALGGQSRVLMDAQNLDRLAFFRWVGAIPLRREAPRAGLRAAVDFLAGPGRAVWIFPQGRQRPTTVRPLGLERGVDLLARLSGAVVVPVGLSYGFREAERPAAAVSFGGALRDPVDLEPALVGLLGANERFFDRAARFDALVPPSGATTEATWSTRALAWIARQGAPWTR